MITEKSSMLYAKNIFIDDRSIEKRNQSILLDHSNSIFGSMPSIVSAKFFKCTMRCDDKIFFEDFMLTPIAVEGFMQVAE